MPKGKGYGRKNRRRGRRQNFRRAKRAYLKAHDTEESTEYEDFKARQAERKTARKARKTAIKEAETPEARKALRTQYKTERQAKRTARKERLANLTPEQKEARRKRRQDIKQFAAARGGFERPVRNRRNRGRRKGMPGGNNPNRFKGRLKHGKGLPPGILKKMSDASQQTPPGAGARDLLVRGMQKKPLAGKNTRFARRLKNMSGGNAMRQGARGFGASSYQRRNRGTGAQRPLGPPGLARAPGLAKRGGTPPGLVNAMKRRRRAGKF